MTSLLDRFIGVNLPKGDRLTDWLRRPLTDDQLRYAASDVEYLLQLTDILQADLEKEGRTSWAAEECELLKDRPRNRRVPEEAILRIKEARSLKGQAFRVATAIAAWREQRAADSNTPVRQVLSDLGVVAIAQQAPETIEKLRGLRGVEGRHLRDGADQEILTARPDRNTDEPIGATTATGSGIAETSTPGCDIGNGVDRTTGQRPST